MKHYKKKSTWINLLAAIGIGLWALLVGVPEQKGIIYNGCAALLFYVNFIFVVDSLKVRRS